MACGVFSCSVRTLSVAHGPSSLTRDGTWAACTEVVESQPLDRQGSPRLPRGHKLLAVHLPLG